MGIDYLVFGNVDSRDYNIEVFFKDVDHTPKRVYEVREVPGRNGAIYIDQKRYEDVPVTYDCVALDDADRKEFVNALAACLGYNRLEDSFNSDEFYNAVFDDDVDPHVTADRSQSTFTLHFTRSAQRYLKEGETAVSVDDGDTLTNPTLFEAKPLISLTGYGNASINGYDIEIKDQLMGAIELQHGWMGNEAVGNGLLTSFYDKIDLPSGLVNVGDTITAGMTATVRVQTINRTALKTFGTPTSVRVTDGQGQTISGVSGTAKSATGAIECTITLPASYDYGDPTQSLECELHFTITPTDGEGSTAYGSFECYVPVKFWQLKQGKQLWLIADVGAIEAVSTGLPTYVIGHYTKSRLNLIVRDVNVDSTAPAYGEPTYIDCELGEVYKETDGDFVSLNRYVSLGSRLPELSAGDNEITFESTFSEVTITPRWWKV